MKSIVAILAAVCVAAITGCASLATTVNGSTQATQIAQAAVNVGVTAYIVSQSNRAQTAAAIVQYANDIEALATNDSTSVSDMQTQLAALIKSDSKINTAEAVALTALMQQITTALAAKSSTLLPANYSLAWATVAEWIITDATPFMASAS